MSRLDISFVDDGRRLEVEAFEGGRSSNEFTRAPAEIDETEDQDVLWTPVDDAIETEERMELVGNYLEHARSAFSQRFLVYPFQASAERLPFTCSMLSMCWLRTFAILSTS